MSLFKKIIVLLLLSIAGLIYFYSTIIQTTLYTATGFSAKNVCSGYFISKFPPEKIRKEALIPVSSLFSMVNYNVDEQNKNVITTVFGFFERKAVFNQATGCTLLGIEQKEQGIKLFTLAPLREQSKYRLENNDGISKEKQQRYIKIVNRAFNENLERNTKAILVLHNGKIIIEKYADGVNGDTPLLGWSMAKSVTALLVGVLVKDKNLDIYADNLMPQWKDKSAHNNINLDHLLRMSSGLDFNEKYGVGSDAAKMLSVEPSASQFAANKKLKYPVDTHWSYSSGTSNIISAVIKNEVSKDADDSFQYYYEFAQQRLFRRLGIESAIMEADAEGTFIGSSYMYLTARDWGKLGQLCLQNGVWDEKRILPESWIDYVSKPTETSNRNSYGAHFWLNKMSDDPKFTRRWPSLPEDLYLMSGFQGQTVAIIPSKQLVVVRLGFTPPGVDRGTEKLIHDILKLI